MRTANRRLTARPCILPYAAAGLFLSLLSGLQFSMVDMSAASLGFLFGEKVLAAEWIISGLVFIFSILIWSMTSYLVADDSISSRLFPVRERSVAMEYVDRLRIERSLFDRLLGSYTVSFLSRYDRVLLQWQFVRLDRKRQSELKRLSILLSSSNRIS